VSVDCIVVLNVILLHFY